MGFKKGDKVRIIKLSELYGYYSGDIGTIEEYHDDNSIYVLVPNRTSTSVVKPYVSFRATHLELVEEEKFTNTVGKDPKHFVGAGEVEGTLVKFMTGEFAKVRGLVVTEGKECYLIHNNPNYKGALVKEMHGYSYSWVLSISTCYKNDFVLVKPEEKPKPTEFKVGDWVITKGYSGVPDGKAVEIKYMNYAPHGTYCYFKHNITDGPNFDVERIVRLALPHEIPQDSKQEDLTGRWVKALVDMPHGGKVRMGEYGKINSIGYADFPSHKDYAINIHQLDYKLYELTPVGFDPKKKGSVESIIDDVTGLHYPENKAKLEVFPGIYVGDIVVSLDNNSGLTRPIGYMCEVLSRSRVGYLDYKSEGGTACVSTDRKAWRKATTVEQYCFQSGGTNITQTEQPEITWGEPLPWEKAVKEVYNKDIQFPEAIIVTKSKRKTFKLII